MKKIKILIGAVLFILISIALNNHAMAIEILNGGKKQLEVGEKIEIRIETIAGTSVSNITWKSNNTSVLKCEPEYKTTHEMVHGAIVEAGKVETEKATIKAIKAGTAKITVEYRIRAHNTWSDKTDSIDITVKDSIKDAQKDVDNAEKNVEDIKNGCKGKAPADSAKYKEIKLFIEGCAYNHGLEHFNMVKLETLKAWKSTCDELNGNWYRNDYSYKIIEGRIKNLEGNNPSYNNESYLDGIKDEYEYSLNAAQKNLDGAKKKLLQINSDLGKGRTEVTFTDVLTDIENYIPTDEASDGRLEKKASIILTTITNIGMILAVLMIAIIGVKYMLGSVEEKADYKKDMIPYLVGACLLFGITVIVKVLQQIGQSINNI